jgi:hypothetical protein
VLSVLAFKFSRREILLHHAELDADVQKVVFIVLVVVAFQ